MCWHSLQSGRAIAKQADAAKIRPAWWFSDWLFGSSSVLKKLHSLAREKTLSHVENKRGSQLIGQPYHSEQWSFPSAPVAQIRLWWKGRVHHSPVCHMGRALWNPLATTPTLSEGFINVSRCISTTDMFSTVHLLAFHFTANSSLIASWQYFSDRLSHNVSENSNYKLDLTTFHPGQCPIKMILRWKENVELCNGPTSYWSVWTGDSILL